MKTFRKYFAFLAIAIGLSSTSFATLQYENFRDQAPNYYIQPNEVYLAPSGIYALIDGALIQIHMLCADNKGIFVPFEEIMGRLARCPSCQRWYDPDSKVPHKCKGNPD